MKTPSCPDPNTPHLAGEHSVATELLKREWAVAMTIGKARNRSKPEVGTGPVRVVGRPEAKEEG